MERERLERLAQDGEAAACYELARVCRREGRAYPWYVRNLLAEDKRCVKVLFVGLRSAGALAQQRETYRTMAFGSRVRELKRQLNLANGDRRTRTLTWEDVCRLVSNREGEGVGTFGSWCAGSVASAYGYRALTTMALAVRVPRGVAVAVGRCDAHKPSAGRAFPYVQPWRHDTRVWEARLKARCQEWASVQLFFSLAQVRRLQDTLL